jgi:hypothetical protein
MVCALQLPVLPFSLPRFWVYYLLFLLGGLLDIFAALRLHHVRETPVTPRLAPAKRGKAWESLHEVCDIHTIVKLYT